ncbi:hypothetical protein AVEN_267167-1 [Araneus ventricosus]|uniref:Uncharacterized protein n=1 Tax=Araneus ventricosus TaxID=182803 RepID=A0A4Y2LJJ1_ARAVE|nr:hypothetical protein AVEN_267167-1 [Araneus ventricosus]
MEEDSRNYRKRKSLQQAKEKRVGSRGSPRIQSGRKAAKHIYSSLSFSDTDSDSNNPPANAIKNIFQNYYVVIKLAGKKSVRFYVGVIISQDAFDEYTVKFMRKCGKDKFTFPENDDIAEVDSSNIVNVLSQPSLNKREQYVFNENFWNIII